MMKAKNTLLSYHQSFHSFAIHYRLVSTAAEYSQPLSPYTSFINTENSTCTSK